MSSDVPPPASQQLKPQRVLACVSCQQRKIKCDRKFPCLNCTKSRAQCVPATLVQRRRRRRFPERELLERLRRYEDLLRQNNIPFETLHNNAATKDAESFDGSDEEQSQNIEPSSISSKNTVLKPVPEPKYVLFRSYESLIPDPDRNIWHAMSQGFRDPGNESDSSNDAIRERVVRKAWDHFAPGDDRLLFNVQGTAVDIVTLHPEPVQIFKLWQTYLDNVHPLLKVTHTPSMQARIIEAVGKLSSVEPTLHALLFSIYCISIVSLDTEDCQSMFGSPREELLRKYQIGCQQSLWSCGYLRSNELDCLTALYLYLVSHRTNSPPISLSALLGVAIRIAKRMGIDRESHLQKCTPMEAEMRRRLWWSLKLFDARIGELSMSDHIALEPTWDCKIPLNVNDSDLRPDMKESPTNQARPTDSLFAVVRAEWGDFMRHSTFYLDLANPSLKQFIKCPPKSPGIGQEMDKLEQTMEERYLKFCDPENPTHFMTIWMTRCFIAKGRLIDDHAKLSSSSSRRTDAQHEQTTAYALANLECDTKIMTSKLTKGFRWFNRLYFPFPAYLQIVQDLIRKPNNPRVQQTWEVLSDNFDASFNNEIIRNGAVIRVLGKVVLQAWEACFAASKETLPVPRIVTSFRYLLEEAQQSQLPLEQLDALAGMDLDDFAMPASTGFSGPMPPYTMGMQAFTPITPGGSPSVPGVATFPHFMNRLDWNAFGRPPGWGNW